MPKYVTPVPRVFESTTRPIIKKITEELCLQFNIPDTTEFVFYGRAENIPISNSSRDIAEQNLRLNTDSRITVEHEESVVNPFEVTVLEQNQRFIFLDPGLHISLKPVRVSIKLELKFEYIAPDRNSAMEWQRQAQLNSYRMASQFNIDVDSHYFIPDAFINHLARLHTIREASDHPENETLGAWFSRCFRRNVTVLSTVDGKRKQYAVILKLTGLKILIDMQEDITPVEKDNEAGNWKASFTITTYYDRTDDMVIRYPLMIHNTLIPAQYREDNPISLHDRSYHEGNRPLHLADLKPFETRRNSNNIQRFTSGIKLPHFDDWIPNYVPPHHAVTTTLLLSMMSNDPRWLFTFDNAYLGDYGFTDAAGAYMKRCGTSLINSFDSLIHIALHEWSDLLAPTMMSIDENLRLETTFDPDPKKMYHLVVSLLCDLTHLSPKGWTDLVSEPDFYYDYVDAVYPGSPLSDVDVGPDGVILIDTVKEALKEAVGEGTASQYSKAPNKNYINGYTLITYRRGK